MRCAEFIDRLEALLDGTLPAEEQARARAHAAECVTCGLIYGSAGERHESPGGGEVPADLTTAILTRTSGPTCGRAQERLAEHADGELEGADRELVDAHLRHCPDCASLATALARLDGDLPALAELEPDAELTAQVLARTLSGADRPSFASGVTALQDRLRRTGRQLLARPRIAWEAGCAATLAVWLVCGASWSPLHGVPAEALELVRQGAAGAQAAGGRSVTLINLRVAELSARGAAAARQGAGAATGGMLDVLAARYRQVAGAAPDAARHWRQLTRAVRDRDLFGGVAALWSLSLDAGAMLAELLFSPLAQVTPAETESPAGRRKTP